MPSAPLLDNISSILGDFDSRLKKLETFAPAGLTPVMSDSAGLIVNYGPALTGGQPYAGTSTEYPGAHSPSFTLQRPRGILVSAQYGGFFGNGGTANYFVIQSFIRLNSNSGFNPATDTYGVTMLAGCNQYQTIGGPIQNGSFSYFFVLPAGQYVISTAYAMQGGATTTGNITKWSVSAYYTAG